MIGKTSKKRMVTFTIEEKIIKEMKRIKGVNWSATVNEVIKMAIEMIKQETIAKKLEGIKGIEN